MTHRPKVSILIVSYNTREMTLAAIDAIVRETHISHEIIVVDNASSDGSVEAIASHPAAPHLIALDENIGFGRANNLAARQARADLILLLNPDTVVLFRAIDALVSFARQRPAAKIWGGRTMFGDGTLNPSSCWQRVTAWNSFCRTAGLAALFPQSPTFNPEAIGGWRRDSVREVDIVSGCFLLTTRELWNALGGFDPKFYMYGEEADFCLRAQARGARPVITPDATIIHFGGASETTRAGKMVKLLAAKISIVDRHMTGWRRILSRIFVTAWPLSRVVLLTPLSLIARTDHSRNTAEEWREIWRRRDEWRKGYPSSASSHSVSVACAAK